MDPTLFLCNSLTLVDLSRAEYTIGLPVVWVVEQSLPDFIPHRVQSFKNAAALDQTIREIWQSGKAAAVVFMEKQGHGFCGIPSGLLQFIEPTAQVIPLWIDNLWDVAFSRFVDEGPSLYLWKGLPLPMNEGWPTAIMEAVLQLGANCLEARPELKDHLGRACVRGLRRRQHQEIITDAFAHKTMKGGILLAVAIELSRWIKKNTIESHVGIVLPPGLPAMLVNLAIVLANKVPVNLNFTIGTAANQSAIEHAGVKTVITAEALIQKIQDFPWPEKRWDVKSLLENLSKPSILFWRAIIRLVPAEKISDWIGLPKKGDRATAGLLFTSGSAGKPKGVPLSHRNILANIAQTTTALPTEDFFSLLGCLPMFHSFGFTVTLWWPLLGGPKVVAYTSPLETGRLAEIIRKHSIHLFVTTPTFLKTFLKKASREQLASLKMVVTGAEKLPTSLKKSFEEMFHIPVCQGYGVTEATPVISVNLFSTSHILRSREGSVGLLLPGIALRTGAVEYPENKTSLDSSGLLYFKGANLFEGYLNDPERTKQVLQNGWYLSGDIGRMDTEGFLHIEGRQIRFSKIGGEMVPHGAIEEAIEQIIGHDKDEVRAIVVGLNDPNKGESIAALIASDIEPAALRHKLAEKGLPNLWIPKAIYHVYKIPLLASGKFDLARAKALVLEFSQTGK